MEHGIWDRQWANGQSRLGVAEKSGRLQESFGGGGQVVSQCRCWWWSLVYIQVLVFQVKSCLFRANLRTNYRTFGCYLSVIVPTYLRYFVLLVVEGPMRMMMMIGQLSFCSAVLELYIWVLRILQAVQKGWDQFQSLPAQCYVEVRTSYEVLMEAFMDVSAAYKP